MTSGALPLRAPGSPQEWKTQAAAVAVAVAVAVVTAVPNPSTLNPSKIASFFFTDASVSEEMPSEAK